MSYPKYEKPYETVIKVGDKEINIKIGKFSEQTAAAVLATCGETVVHTTIALGRKVNIGYFPLQVEYSEKLYAGGIIKGSRWVKREGKPTDEAILKARVIDRSIRPLFPKGMTNEVQIINTVFSYDGENDPGMVALLAATVGLAISPIPFMGPIAGVKVGYSKKTEEFTFNPVNGEKEDMDLDLIVAGSGDAVVMVEAGANEISEAVVIEAMTKAQHVLGQVCEQIGQIVSEVGKDKLDLVEAMDPELEKVLTKTKEKIAKDYAKEIRTMVEKKATLQDPGLEDFATKIVEDLGLGKETEEADAIVIGEKEVKEILYELMKLEVRKMILEENVRPDGRKTDQIRSIWCEVDIFPRTHGSAMFKRGATQACTVTTLGNPSLGQYIEDLEGETVRHYIHHYNMPPFASGEAGRFGWPKRREIGHGALAERALLPMIPDQNEFPYTIRVVSEILSSNGSTSQASVCGSTMSLMAAGVPIKKPVSGIAMGLMSDGKKYVVLSDIQGLEDHVGDMDFKIAGSKDGITAIQMDIKLTGIPREVLEQALEQAKVGRLHILKEMLKVIKEPKTKLSKYAPKVEQITIDASRIGELIGPGGKIIKNIIEVSGAEVNVDEDPDKQLGIVNISSEEQNKIDVAKQMIEDMMRVIEIGDEFNGAVTRIEDYGAFVSLIGGKDGLVHVSQMSTEFIRDPRNLVQLGDTIHVRVTEIKDDGKIGLSMLSKEEEEQVRSSRRSGGSDRGGRGGDRGYKSSRNDRSSSRGGRDDRRGGDRGSRGSRDNRGSRSNSRVKTPFKSMLTDNS